MKYLYRKALFILLFFVLLTGCKDDTQKIFKSSVEETLVYSEDSGVFSLYLTEDQPSKYEVLEIINNLEGKSISNKQSISFDAGFLVSTSELKRKKYHLWKVVESRHIWKSVL